MISRLDKTITTSLYCEFATALGNAGFSGDIDLGYADRVVLATDNSIYQVLPEGVLYPRSTADLSTLMTLMAKPAFHSVVISPRGGGTGTNGQSLTPGFMMDTSRYMNQVLEINVKERWARVQAGVVKDQLNELAAKEGLFFAPELSTSNRATVGGMVNTDASGQGSVVYGKTRHHVLELTSVLSDGSVWVSGPLADNELASICQRKDTVGNVHRVVNDSDKQHHETVKNIFPKLNRNLTGYDLANIRNKASQFDLNAILCGSEGTLALISEIKINLLPIPEQSALVVVFYDSFQASLKDAQVLMSAKPDSIETIDSKVLNLAKNDTGLWATVKEFFPENSNGIDGINFVEFTGDDDAINHGISRLITVLEKSPSAERLDHATVMGAANVKKIWAMRKQSVALLGNMSGDARPIPFVEDVAVPPENLAAFIQQFRELLDKHQLRYGMFGHVDAGVLHVRPAIDMKDPQQAVLVRAISDEVAHLAQRHGGVLWGEHGKGIRSEYAPAFFAELYPVLQQIKAAFDPRNQLNPGKIATPAQAEQQELLKIDGVPTRGERDRLIERDAFEVFSKGMYCNGNGACFNYQADSAMCPTWKATLDRVQSPKGRSTLVRDWLRLQSIAGTRIDKTIEEIRAPSSVLSVIKNAVKKMNNQRAKWRGEEDFSHDVYKALDSCMSCKSCAGQCPIQVNVPDIRSRFFELYHSRYPRPIKHYVAATLERALPVLARVKSLYNLMVQLPWVDAVIARTMGLTALPVITSASPIKDICRSGAAIASPSLLKCIPDSEKSKTVIIVQDAFTSFFDTPLLTDLTELLIRLGYRPLIAPFNPNGKVLHVYGFHKGFHRVARSNATELNALANSGVPLVGIDAAVTLTYRDEYHEVPGCKVPTVQLLSEWFASEASRIKRLNLTLTGSYTLLGHCTEVTNTPASVKQWQTVFAACGLSLKYQPTGCCGMSGIYGHEAPNQQTSRKLYDMSWKAVVENPENTGMLVATGYSCRSQVKRFSNQRLKHPLQALLEKLQ
ncbi:FAD-binding and (Fe-S)-binding domain-containing protein [Candidatus Sororendozoicomonas aggregata]|uniref:D-2-hydroxyglutarate dehydrogenase YdiJ n=1 Tax=Candidatus Sororendozoicomonas aggregata TaxID=3073239 RepID=UPI002ED146DA